MKYNYHTHTKRCLHAVGKDEAYVKSAIKNGFDEIGFSDHAPWPFKDFYSGMRMTVEELDGYVNSIRKLREKYKDKISIKIGFECEFYDPYIPWLKEKVEEYKLDYLILGHHFDHPESSSVYYGLTSNPADIIAYANGVVRGIESGIFSYVAHPDLFMKSYPTFDETCVEASKKIIQCAIDHDTPLEYNLLGLKFGIKGKVQNYPYIEFWKLVCQMGAKVVIGIDAHDPRSFGDTKYYDLALKTLNELGANLTDEIRFFKHDD